MLPWSLTLSADVRAHGGEDHGGVVPGEAVAEAARVPTWSSEFEAVLRLDDLHAGHEGRGTLLVADWRTSAPVAAGKATLDLEGPADLLLEAAPGGVPGEWPFTATFPAAGPWTGTLTLLTPDRSDALGLPSFTLPPEQSPAGLAGSWTLGGVACVGLAAAAVGLALGGAVGLFGGRRVAGAAAGLAALGLGARADGNHGEGLRMGLDSQFLLGLRTEVVAPAPFARSVRALGTTVARPGGAAELHAPVTGVVAFPEGRTLLPGDVVQAGEVLATIVETMSGADRSSYGETRAAAKVRLAEARKALAVAERDFARIGGLGEVLSERERLEREKAVEVAREGLRQAEAEAAALDDMRPKTVLRAPLSGRISALVARPGDVVSPADVLLRITDAGGLWVEAKVPETWAGQLAIGGAAEITADARPDVALRATVLDPGLEAEPASGALRVVLAVAEPVEWLVPGMTVTASIAAGAPREAIAVPDAAVVDGAGETLVFVKTAPERFEARPVRAGARMGERREIELGLSPGERVVIQGTYALRSLAGR
jgi:cobalt-zinc-cadmium efflux system membrane fusion protein